MKKAAFVLALTLLLILTIPTGFAEEMTPQSVSGTTWYDNDIMSFKTSRNLNITTVAGIANIIAAACGVPSSVVMTIAGTIAGVLLAGDDIYISVDFYYRLVEGAEFLQVGYPYQIRREIKTYKNSAYTQFISGTTGTYYGNENWVP